MAKKRAAKQKPAGKPGRRKPGHPKPGEPVVTPLMLRQMGDALLDGQACTAIADRLGIDESTVRHYRDNTLRPRWEDEAKANRAFQLAKIDRLEAFAWDRLRASTQPMKRRQIKKALCDALGEGEKGRGKAEGGRGKVAQELQIVERVMASVTKTGEACWAQVIQWCADYRARVFGYYAPTKHQVELNELRVAGSDPEAVDRAMIERLAAKIRERQAFQAALRPGKN